MLSRFLPLLLLAFSGAALAGTEPALAVPASEADFGAQRAQIEKKLADGKTYAEIAPGDRQRVTEALQRMSDELAGVDSTEQMQTAVRSTRAASLRAAKVLAESYTAMVSGVLMGMADAMQTAAKPKAPSAAKRK